MKFILSRREKEAVLAVCLCLLLYIILPFVLTRFFPEAAELCRKHQFFSMMLPGIAIYFITAWYSGDFIIKKSDFQGINICKITLWSVGMLPVNALGTALWMAFLKFVQIEFDTNVPIEMYIKSCSGIEVAGIGIFVCILTPLIEESIFRRVIFEGVHARCPTIFSITATSLLFAALHGILFQLLPLFVLGLYFQILYCRSGKAGASIYAHFVNNTIAFFILLAVKYFPEI